MSYKEDMTEVIIILDQIIKLLESVNKDLGLQPYIRVYKYFRNDCGCAESEKEANNVRREILHTYSQGMASFNDLALGSFDESGFYVKHPKGDEFYELKHKLFETLVDQL